MFSAPRPRKVCFARHDVYDAKENKERWTNASSKERQKMRRDYKTALSGSWKEREAYVKKYPRKDPLPKKPFRFDNKTIESIKSKKKLDR